MNEDRTEIRNKLAKKISDALDEAEIIDVLPVLETCVGFAICSGYAKGGDRYGAVSAFMKGVIDAICMLEEQDKSQEQRFQQ
jgi:hypothetical protein